MADYVNRFGQPIGAPRVKSALTAWLDPSNFVHGRQKQSLGDVMEAP